MNIQFFTEAACGVVVQVGHGTAGMSIPCAWVLDPFMQASAVKIVLGWMGV